MIHLPDDSQAKQDLFTAQFLTFGLLGQLLVEMIDADTLRALRDEETFAEIPFAAAQTDVQQGLALIQAWLQSDEISNLVAALESDYTHLFVGVGDVLAPPWESVYFSQARLLFREQTIQVRYWYLRYGLAAEKLNQEPDDHIALELNFVAQLAQRATTAVSAGDDPTAAQLIEAQGRFLEEHLLRWAPFWTEDVIEHARTDFYHGLALLVRGALGETARLLDLTAEPATVRV
jgi:TorA maturation chaperone TorD